MTKDLKNLSSLEAIVLQEDDLLMIRGGQSDAITCGKGCGQSCGNNCGNGCNGNCTSTKEIDTGSPLPPLIPS